MKREYLKRVRLAAAVLLVIAAGASYCFSSRDSGSVDLTEAAAKTAGAEAGKTADQGTKAEADTEAGSAAVETGAEADAELQTETGAETEAKTETAVCFVYVCGEVNNPGVYELAEGSRIYAAIEAAGGFTEQAAKAALNLAAPAADGMQITVYSEAELRQAEKEGAAARSAFGSGIRTDAGSGAETSSGGGKSNGTAGGETSGAQVNLNTASKAELMTLPGIGESKAEKILRYREENGRFETIEDIMKVSGIKEAGFQKIKDRITV